MRISVLTIGAIASIIAINSVFADTTTSTVTSRDYVDAQDALKQDIIPTPMDELELPVSTTLVTNDLGDNEIRGDRFSILDGDALWTMGHNWWPNSGYAAERELINLDTEENYSFSDIEHTVPTAMAVSKALYYIVENMSHRRRETPLGYYIDSHGYGRSITIDTERLDSDVKGAALVTKTDNCIRDNTAGDFYSGYIPDETCASGERLIFEEGSNYTGTDLEKIQIPTVGAMMSAISNNTPSLPTGTAGNVVTYNASGRIGGAVATYTGAAAYNASNDSAKIPTMAGVTNYAQAKKTCAGWPDGTTVADATHTNANCWLWNLPD